MDTTTAGPDLGPALAGATRPIGYYAACRGYDPAFLGVSVPVPVLTEEQRRNAAKNTAADPGSDDTVLPYTHFSLVMNRGRQLAYYTVVNIDGAESIELERADDKWYFDPRIAESEQIGEGLYRRNALDRGHLVRRLDPVWGDRGPRANDDTFHFTNCSPQHERFNQGQDLWQGLENFLLGHADLADQRLTVFTGPVMAEDDPLYKGVRLPLAFWKIAVFRRPTGELAASAYSLEQAALISELPDLEAAFDAGMYRVTLAELGERTGLDFGYLAAHETPLDSSGLERAPTRLPIGADFANVAL